MKKINESLIKKIAIILFFAIVLFLMISVSKQREAKLLSKIDVLEKEIDSYKFGSDKILAKMRLAYDEKLYLKCGLLYQEMKDRHPDTQQFIEATEIYNEAIKQKELEEIARKTQAEEAMKKRAELEKERELAKRNRIKKEQEDKEKALKNLKKTHDDVSGNTWYKQHYFTHYSNLNKVSIYAGSNSTSKWLRLEMSYSGNDWIFFKKAYLSYDGNTKEITFNDYQEKKSDHSSGKVWEWIDVSINRETLTFLADFAKSPNAKVRFSGKYTDTRVLTKEERQGILDVINAFPLIPGETSFLFDL